MNNLYQCISRTVLFDKEAQTWKQKMGDRKPLFEYPDSLNGIISVVRTLISWDNGDLQKVDNFLWTARR